MPVSSKARNRKHKKEQFMKMSRLAITLFGGALLFGSVVLAGVANKTTLNVGEKINVQGKSLDPGAYKVEWTGTGSTAQVSLLKGKDVVATFPAQVTEESNKNPDNAYGSVAGPDGSRSLTAIYVGGQRTVLQLDQAAASQPSTTQNAK
jgi:hypothetical protein